MAQINWRTINIDALDPDSAANFDLSSLTPAIQPVSTADVQTLAGQVKQLLRGGDQEGALRGALENAPYGADERGKVGALWNRTFTSRRLRRMETGNPCCDSHRDLAVDTAIRNVADAATDIPVRRWK